MKVLYFGIYNPNYSRNRVLIGGLRKNGVEVSECNVRYHSFFSYLKLFWKYLFLKKAFDAMIVGFPGQESMLLARLLTRKPIIFDAFTSHYGGYVLDRGKYGKKSLRAKWYKWLDRKSVKLANMALLDTNAHIDFFVNELGLPRDKFRRIFVGILSLSKEPAILSKRLKSWKMRTLSSMLSARGRIIVKAEPWPTGLI